MAEQKLRFKRGTKEVLEAKLIGTNKPLKGEPIFESDTNKFKIGNGISDYKDLPYISGGEGPNEYIKSASISGKTLTLVKQDGSSVVFDASYSAGDGIEITENTINVDSTIARQADLTTEITERKAADADLDTRLKNVEGRGRFLSAWDCTTGKPTTEPTTPLPYIYKSGDYYLVSKVATNRNANNYKPTGTQYTGVASTIVETEQVLVGNQYTFDGTNWTLIGSTKDVAWGQIIGDITDQEDLVAEFEKKQDVIDLTHKLYSDLVDTTGQSNLFVDAYEKQEIAKIINKADYTDLQNEITRATNAEYELNSQLIQKADKSYVDMELMNKASTSELQSEVSRAESAESNLSYQVSQKADTSYVEQALSQKADKSEVEQALSQKADISYVDSSISSEKSARESADITLQNNIDQKSTVSVSATGSATDEVQYITIDNTEYKLAGGGSGEATDETVKFTDDLTTMYTIGKYNGTIAQAVTIPAKNKTLKEVLKDVFNKEEFPKATQPSLVISSSNIGAYEAGTNIAVSYTTTFNKGLYTFGPDTGIVASDYKIKFNNETLTATSGAFTSVQVTDSTNLKITGTFDHTQGAMPKTNIGNDYPDVRIPAVNDKAAQEKGTLTGYRKMFYGTRADKTDLDSAKIRALGSEKQAAKTINVSIPIGAFRTIIAVPSTRTVTSIKDVNASSAEILSAFVQSTLNVEGANNYSAIQYKIYVLDYAEAIGTANTYTVTVK